MEYTVTLYSSWNPNVVYGTPQSFGTYDEAVAYINQQVDPPVVHAHIVHLFKVIAYATYTPGNFPTITIGAD